MGHRLPTRHARPLIRTTLQQEPDDLNIPTRRRTSQRGCLLVVLRLEIRPITDQEPHTLLIPGATRPVQRREPLVVRTAHRGPAHQQRGQDRDLVLARREVQRPLAGVALRFHVRAEPHQRLRGRDAPEVRCEVQRAEAVEQVAVDGEAGLDHGGDQPGWVCVGALEEHVQEAVVGDHHRVCHCGVKSGCFCKCGCEEGGGVVGRVSQFGGPYLRRLDTLARLVAFNIDAVSPPWIEYEMRLDNLHAMSHRRIKFGSRRLRSWSFLPLTGAAAHFQFDDKDDDCVKHRGGPLETAMGCHGRKNMHGIA